MGDNDGVTYTIKELLARQDLKLDLILAQVADKADASSVAHLEKRITTVETAMAVLQGVSSNTRWIVFTGIPVVASLAVIGSRFVH